MNSAKINVPEQVTQAVEQAREAAQNVSAKVTDFFQGNPFDNEVGKKIEMATDADKLATDNWGLNMEICDYINYTDDGGRNAIRALRRRLHDNMGKNNGVVMYALTVLETCVKNCDQRFKALVCQKEFANELVRMIGAKFDAPQAVQERVLGMIQSWADAFRGNPALCGVAEVYDELKSKGVEFPPTDFDQMAPIITPKRTVFNDPPAPTPAASVANTAPLIQFDTNVPLPSGATEASAVTQPTQPVDPLTKLRADVDVVTVNITVLRDLLTELTPGEELPEEWALVQDLHSSLKAMQHRIVDLINSEFSEDVTFELLTVNQEINNAIEKYDRHLASRSGQPLPTPTPEKEEHRQLREQLESFGVYEGVGTSKATEQQSQQHEQQVDSLRTVAFDKPMLTDEQAQEVEEWLGQDVGNAPPLPKKEGIPADLLPKKPDDGL